MKKISKTFGLGPKRWYALRRQIVRQADLLVTEAIAIQRRGKARFPGRAVTAACLQAMGVNVSITTLRKAQGKDTRI